MPLFWMLVFLHSASGGVCISQSHCASVQRLPQADIRLRQVSAAISPAVLPWVSERFRLASPDNANSASQNYKSAVKQRRALDLKF